jgi:hypothetical protein
MGKFLAWLLLGAALLTGAALLIRVPWASGPPEDNLPESEPPDPELVGPELFKEVTAVSGVHWTYRNGEDFTLPSGETSTHLAILESLGGGVALIDYDGDGLLDIFVVGGGYYAGKDHQEIRGYPCKLYRNLGNFKFKDVTHEVGLDTLAGKQPWFYSHAAAVGDYDRDGWPDLLVTGWGRVALFHNEPVDPKDPRKGRKFVDVSAQAGLDKGITWATSAAFADLDGDGYPDLYVCQYVNWSWDTHRTCFYDPDRKIRDVCPPKDFQGLPHKLYHNVPVDPRNPSRGRKFMDVSAQAGLEKGGPSKSKGLGVVIVDVNLDGKPDIFVANDTVENFLYINESTPGKIRLKEQARISGVARDGNANPNGNMGVDAGDPEGSGLPWLWVTTYENEMHALFLNQCQKDRILFFYHTPASGIGAIGQKFVGWGTGFVDVDHHGWEDLFIANGHAIRYPRTAERRQRPVLLRNWNGRFKDISKRGGDYFKKNHLARGVALGDLDNDGKVDVVVSHMNEPVAVLRNIAPRGNHWLGVDLVGADNADVVGARVVLEAGGRKQTRFAKGGGSYASAPDRRLVFGLGMTDKIDKVSVFWPNGKQQEWTGLRLDRYHVLVQGEKKARTPRGNRK